VWRQPVADSAADSGRRRHFRGALLDDSTRLADRARVAGVDVTLNIVDEMYHVFPAMSSFLPEAREAEIGRFVQGRTSRPAIV
jgi:acetyl esterase/lipase